jgi:glycine dehydrogenase subunit 2
MIEPTETESKATLDAFAAALEDVVEQARQAPDELRSEPRSLPVGRLDEVAAARNPVLRWSPCQPASG